MFNEIKEMSLNFDMSKLCCVKLIMKQFLIEIPSYYLSKLLNCNIFYYIKIYMTTNN